MSEQFLEYFPNDFIHLLLSAYSADETGHVAGQSPIKKSQKVSFSSETEIYKLMKSNYEIDLNEYLKNWFVYDIIDDAQTGYLGLILENKINRQLVLSHRSTNFKLSFLQNIFKQSGVECDSLSVVIGKITIHQIMACIATQKAVEFAKQLNYSLSFCGHSLGAWLAELSVYYCHCEFVVPYANVKAITFDGPGSWEMMELMDKQHTKGRFQMNIKQFDIVHYLSAPNIVNCMNSHVGIGYRLYPEDNPLNYYKTVQKALDQITFRKNVAKPILSVLGHDLKYIIPCFDPKTGKPYPKNYLQIVKWPKITYKGSGHNFQMLVDIIKQNICQLLPEKFKSVLEIIVPTIFSSQIIASLSCTTLCAAVIVKELIDGKISFEKFWNVHQCTNSTNLHEKDQKLNGVDIFSQQLDTGYQIINPNDFERGLQMDKCYEFIDNHLITLYKNSKGLSQSNSKKTLLSQIDRIVKTYKIRKTPYQEIICIKDEWKIQKVTIDTIRDQIRILIRDFKDDFEEYLNEIPEQINKIDCFFDRIFNYDNNFVQRKHLIDIETAFTKSNIVVITGSPKFGKTTLAYQYAKSLKNQFYTKVWPFNAQNQSNMHQDLCFCYNHLFQLTTQTKTFQNLVAEVWAKLKNLQLNLIIIFDNVEKLGFIQPFINQTPENIKIIITAVNNQIFSNTNYEIVNISAMDQEECLNFINNKIIKRELDENQKNQIINLSNGIPQTLSFYISEINNPQNNLRSMQDILMQLIEYQKTHSIYDLFIEQLEDDLCKTILKYIFWLYPNKIEIDLLLKLMKNKIKDFNQVKVNNCFLILADQALINILQNQCITIDYSIQEECRRQQQSLDHLSQVLQYFSINLPDIQTVKHTQASYDIAQKYHLHARNLINLIIEKKFLIPFLDNNPELFQYATTITLKLSVIYQYLIIDYQSCKTYMDLYAWQEGVVQKKQLNPIDQKVHQIQNFNQYQFYLSTKENKKLIQQNSFNKPYLKDFIEKSPDILANEHFQAAILYQQNQDFDLSNQELNSSKQICTYDINDIRYYKIGMLQAENLQLQKQYYDAMLVSISILQQIEKQESLKDLRLYFIFKAKLYYQIGKIASQTNQDPLIVEEYFFKSIQIWEEKLKSQESIEVADVTLNFGLLFKSLKQYPQSLQQFENACEIKRKILSTDQNSQIAEIYFEKGLLYMETNEIDLAEKEFWHAKKLIFGSDNFELKQNINFQIAQIYKLKDLKFEYIKNLEKIISKKRQHYTYIHPSLSSNLKSLADAYAEQFQDNAKQTQLYSFKIFCFNQKYIYLEKPTQCQINQKVIFSLDSEFNIINKVELKQFLEPNHKINLNQNSYSDDKKYFNTMEIKILSISQYILNFLKHPHYTDQSIIQEYSLTFYSSFDRA